MANPIIQQVSAELAEVQAQLSKFKSNVDYLDSARADVDMAMKAVNTAEVNFQNKVKELQGTYDTLMNLTDETKGLILKIEDVNFPERLGSIEATVKETVNALESTKEATLNELQKASKAIIEADFDSRFINLQTAVSTAIRNSIEIAEDITKKQLPEQINSFEKTISTQTAKSFKEVRENSQKLAAETAKTIADLSLPMKLENVQVGISEATDGIKKATAQLDKLRDLVSDTQQEAALQRTKALSELEERLSARMEKLGSALINQEEKQKITAYITWGLIVLGSALAVISKFP